MRSMVNEPTSSALSPTIILIWGRGKVTVVEMEEFQHENYCFQSWLLVFEFSRQLKRGSQGLNGKV
jgi:hypothetical protein